MESARAAQRSRRSQIASGGVLVAIGLVVLALQYFEGPGRAIVLLLAGGSFIAAYFYTEIYGLLIPGGILCGLGLGILGEWREVSLGDPNAVGLGIGFVSIYVIERLHRHRAHWWSLIPGGILIASGFGTRFGDLGHILWRIAPAILVSLGLLIVVRAIRRGPSSTAAK